MQTPIRKHDWARHAAEYCRALAPYATPLLEISKDVFNQISHTRARLEAEENVEALIESE